MSGWLKTIESYKTMSLKNGQDRFQKVALTGKILFWLTGHLQDVVTYKYYYLLGGSMFQQTFAATALYKKLDKIHHSIFPV